MKILFLTYSNIKTDARIIRSFKSLLHEFKDSTIIGYGITSIEGDHESKHTGSLNLGNINLLFSKCFLPKSLKEFLVFFELNFRFFLILFKLRPRLVHVNDFHPLLAVLIYRLIVRIKIIYDAHELESQTGGTNGFKSAVILLLEKLSWNKIDMLITPSRYINKWYLENIGKKRNIVILNTPENETNILEYDDNYFRNLYGISDSSKVFIYVGILNHGRGIDLLLEVFLDSSLNSHLVFLGYGPYKEKIIHLSGFNQRIHYHSPVSHEIVTSLVRTADVGFAMIENVSLSDYYCAPNKLFEYAFSRIYILASDFPEMRRIILNHNLGELVSNDKLSLLNKVKEIESRSSVKLDRINLEELSWSHQSELLIESYRELL